MIKFKDFVPLTWQAVVHLAGPSRGAVPVDDADLAAVARMDAFAGHRDAVLRSDVGTVAGLQERLEGDARLLLRVRGQLRAERSGRVVRRHPTPVYALAQQLVAVLPVTWNNSPQYTTLLQD